MLLHDSSISSCVNSLLLRVFPSNKIVFCYSTLRKWAVVMSQDRNNFTSICDNSSPDDSNLASGDSVKKKPTSFQITSVTVQGSRLSTDGGDDSCDDLDVSHTEELSSEVSRTTEDIPESNPSPTKEPPPDPTNSDKPLDTTNAKPPSLPDQWQHRFKVVKIVSSRPFKKGRWVCMDFNDPPSVATSETNKPETPESAVVPTLPNMSAGFDASSQGQAVNNVAHVYEIAPNASYPGSISVTVSPQPVQQPFYGIFLPLTNPQYPDMATVPPPFAQDSFDPKSQFVHQAVPFVQQTHVQQNYVNNTPQDFTSGSSQMGSEAIPSQQVIPQQQMAPDIRQQPQVVHSPNLQTAATTQQAPMTAATSQQPQMTAVTTQQPPMTAVTTQQPQMTAATTQQAPMPTEVTTNTQDASIAPSHVTPHNHVDAADPPTTEVTTEPGKDSAEAESTPGAGGSTVAIDNKIEQAMDLVKSHLMFAVREEVDVLKEKITELMERISLLEYENGFLKANATQETLSQLTQSQQLQQQQLQQQQTQNVTVVATQQTIQQQQQPSL